MSDCTIAHHRLAFDDFYDDIHLLIGEHDADTLAERACIATDGNKPSVAVETNGDVARETQDPFTA